MKEMDEIRYRIDRIDATMRDLFRERMQCAAEIADLKSLHGLPIYDEERERQVIRQNADALDERDLRPFYERFLTDTMRLSRQYQSMRTIEKQTEDCDVLHMELGRDGYDIFVGNGLLSRVGERFHLNRKVLIVTDDGVPAEYAGRVAAQCRFAKILTVAQGEASKNLSNLERIWKTLVDEDFTRTDCAIAVGGGVVGDLTGFAAACYQRGIDFYNIPTTLLSQVDSSIGGKNAIDFCNIKNSVGTFYQPSGVLIDPLTLSTLPPRQLANGLAEAIKMSLTSDAELFSLFEAGVTEEDWKTVILRSLKIKKAVVEMDEREAGLRRVLNFGHTLGHGIETVSDLFHGECISLGMLPMCAPAVRNRLERVLTHYGLPVEYPFDTEAALLAVSHDKKRSGEMISVVFCPAPGSYSLEQIPMEEWKKRIRFALKKKEDC